MSGITGPGPDGPRGPWEPGDHTGPNAAHAGADPFATWDGAYVLGALSPQDRAAYEAHLLECPECARAVRELAGMPGLLGLAHGAPQAPQAPQAPGTAAAAAAAATAADAGQPPADLLPALLARVRRERARQRRRAVVPGVGLALAACLALLLVLVLPGGDGDAGSEAQTPSAGEIEMTPLVRYPVWATVSLTDADWGTRVTMDCLYGADSVNEYVLVAITLDGDANELASWSTLRDRDVSFSVGTELSEEDIATLEVRSTDGYPVLRADMAGQGT